MTQIGNPALLRYKEAKKGVGKRTVAQVKAGLGATDERMARIAGVSRKTFITHVKKGAFNAQEAERILRVEEILDAAMDILGATDEVRAWLARPNRSLGNEAPIELLSSSSGAEAVHDVLLRMRHGVYA